MYSGGAMRRWGATLALGLSLTVGATANPDDAARKFPAATELFVTGKVLPSPSVTRDLLVRLEANPAIEALLDQIPSAAYLNFREDVLPLVEGHVSAAWVRTGANSPYDAQEKREIQESAYVYLKVQLKELGLVIDKFKAKYKRLPKDLKELTAKKLVDSVPTSAQADFKLVKTAKGYSVISTYKGTLNLAEVADAPTYVGGEGLVEGKKKPKPPLNLVLSFQCADVALARKTLAKLTDNKMLTAVDADHWTIPVDEMSPWTIEIESGWIVASDNPELLKQYGSTTAPNLTSNVHYQAQRQLLPVSSEENVVFGFFDIDDLMKTTSSFADLPPISKVFGSIGAVQKYTPSSASEIPTSSLSEIFVETQMSAMNTTASNSTSTSVAVVSPGQDEVRVGETGATRPGITGDVSLRDRNLFGEGKSASIQILTTTGNVTNPIWSWIDIVPGQSSIIYAINVGEGLRLLEQATKLDPDVDKLWGNLYTQGLKALGLDVTTAEVNRSTGWLVVETEIVDQIFGMANEVRRIGMSSPDAPDSGVALMISQLAKLPQHWSLQILDPALEQKFAIALWNNLGDKSPSHTVGTTSYWMRGDKEAALATLPPSGGQPGRLALTGKISKRLFLRSLDVAGGKGEKLAELNSFRDFQAHVHGRPLLFTHQKIDWLYSIIKGILLAVDSQSRPEAEVIGQYRDTYAAITIEPRGLRGYAGLYSAEGPMQNKTAAPVANDYLRLHDAMATDFRAPKAGAEASKEGGQSAFANARSKGQLTACKSNLKNIATALEMYATDNSGHYPKKLGQLTPNYLKMIPNCPAAQKDTYSAHYKMGVKPDSYSVYCWGHNHSEVQVPANRPAYNSERGIIEK